MIERARREDSEDSERTANPMSGGAPRLSVRASRTDTDVVYDT